MSDLRACAGCLRRAWLLVALSPYIERVATGRPGSRSPELLGLDDEDLARAVAPRGAAAILSDVAGVSESEIRGRVRAAGAWAVCRHDERFPAGLREARDAPRSLICRGDPGRLELLDPGATVTVVGSRRATAYGREVARSLGSELAGTGLLVASGLAFGIDAAAHRGALERGMTVAVTGCGPDVAYPAAHRSLHRRIGESGLIVSELAPGATPWRWTFPARNRVMAGLASMTVVVEAAVRSGSLITAEMAAELGRDVGAVPGPVNSGLSAATNELLSRGACVVRGAQDVLDAMLGPGAVPERPPGPPLEPALAEVLAGFERLGGNPDAVAGALGLGGPELSLALARLELLGYLRGSPLGAYVRTALAPP
ncbi:MAG: DNA-processing protein DprA [Solirubrobacterales bacterium]